MGRGCSRVLMFDHAIHQDVSKATSELGALVRSSDLNMTVSGHIDQEALAGFVCFVFACKEVQL